ncbi:MAG: hypothetical protein LBS82_01120 [Spirochaetaceae bacterium]|jgi:hypothetical protein|nr:hypothetical protein [Spirochaetaceae bacterium]
MAKSKDWVPTREQDLVDLLAHWDAMLGDSAQKTAFGWDGVVCAQILIKISEFLDARAEYQAEKTKSRQLAKDRKKAAVKAAMRKFANSSVRFNDKMQPEDKLELGIGPHDETDTEQGEVGNAVDMTITNDPLANSHRHILHYRKLGSKSKAKAPWHMAVFQTYIQGPGDPDPDIRNEAMWSKDIINMTTPLKHQHNPADAGKMAWYRAHWEANGGKKGDWSMACATIP